MRYRQSIAVVSYLVISAVWVYWLLDKQVSYGNPAADWALLACFAALHVAVGLGTGRWWATVLPLVPLAMALPLGYPADGRGEPLPIWVGLLFWAPVGAFLLALGVGCRLLGRRWKEAGGL